MSSSQILMEIIDGPHGPLALLTLAALAQGLAWLSPAPPAAAELSLPAALDVAAARLAPLVRVRITLLSH